MIESEKNILRGNLKKLRNSLSEHERDIANLAICKHISQLQEIMRAKIIAAYMPMKDEIDLVNFFAKFAEKQFCFPRCKAGNIKNTPDYEMAMTPRSTFRDNQISDYFTAGKFGIFEPVKGSPDISGDKIDVWLIPGVGFDSAGNRLGRGGGFYDRLLEKTSSIKIGVGYDMQLVADIPNGQHDQRMDIIITQKGVIRVEK